MNEKKKGIIVLAVLLLFVALVVALIIIDNVNSKKELDKFMKYYNSHEYSIRVFVFFILIDFIRLLILFVFAIHVLKSEQEYAPNPRN